MEFEGGRQGGRALGEGSARVQAAAKRASSCPSPAAALQPCLALTVWSGKDWPVGGGSQGDTVMVAGAVVVGAGVETAGAGAGGGAGW